MSRPWKPDLYVVARFLDRLAEREAWSKGKLQPAVRLNYELFLRYLEHLEQRGLLARDGDGRRERVRITAAGPELRRSLADWIRSVFGDL